MYCERSAMANKSTFWLDMQGHRSDRPAWCVCHFNRCYPLLCLDISQHSAFCPSVINKTRLSTAPEGQISYDSSLRLSSILTETSPVHLLLESYFKQSLYFILLYQIKKSRHCLRLILPLRPISFSVVQVLQWLPNL